MKIWSRSVLGPFRFAWDGLWLLPGNKFGTASDKQIIQRMPLRKYWTSKTEPNPTSLSSSALGLSKNLGAVLKKEKNKMTVFLITNEASCNFEKHVNTSNGYQLVGLWQLWKRSNKLYAQWHSKVNTFAPESVLEPALRRLILWFGLFWKLSLNQIGLMPLRISLWILERSGFGEMVRQVATPNAS